jgi:opacity protein-like surface antigen
MRSWRLLLAAACLGLVAVPASAGTGKIELYGIRMEPSDRDAQNYSRPGWGAGLQVVAPLPNTEGLLAFVGGLEAVNLLSKTIEFRDALTGLRVEQQTSQNYGRFFVGGQFGSHSSGALRPYVGANVALVMYGIGTDVVVPDDRNRENEIRQNLRSRTEAAFGWDVNAGLDVNFRDRWNLSGGVRWLHSYGLPEQLGADAVSIEPAYVQFTVGAGVGFGTLRGIE